jgi:predicted nucleotidyltransferase
MITNTDSISTSNSLREKAQPVIAEATRRLVAEFHPEQVWLFGSYAWGEPTEDSDLDLLMLVQDEKQTSIQRLRQARRCLRSIDMAKDVLIQSTASFERYKGVRSSMSHKIAEEGQLVYAAN